MKEAVALQITIQRIDSLLNAVAHSLFVRFDLQAIVLKFLFLLFEGREKGHVLRMDVCQRRLKLIETVFDRVREFVFPLCLLRSDIRRIGVGLVQGLVGVLLGGLFLFCAQRREKGFALRFDFKFGGLFPRGEGGLFL